MRSSSRSPTRTGATARSGTPTPQAVNDMVDRTSTPQAPWTLVEAEDKHWARVKVLKTLCRADRGGARRTMTGPRRMAPVPHHRSQHAHHPADAGQRADMHRHGVAFPPRARLRGSVATHSHCRRVPRAQLFAGGRQGGALHDGLEMPVVSSWSGRPGTAPRRSSSARRPRPPAPAGRSRSSAARR